MKTKEQLLKNQAKELEQFEREQSIRALLPEPINDDASVCLHKNYSSVKVWSDFRTNRTLADAVKVLRLFADKVQTCEHWKNGCVSTYPPQINEYAKQESSTMDGSHAVEILVHGGKGFGPIVELRFWAETESGLIEFSCPVSDLFKLVPQIQSSYNKHGELVSCRVDWPVESRCVDSFRSWWSENPAYRGSYYLADLPNFYSLAGQFIKEPVTA